VKNSAVDAYCYPGTILLRNLADIRDAEKLAAFEAAFVATRLLRLSEHPLTGAFDTARLQATHRWLFGGVYSWAGQLRQHTGTMAKQRATGTVVTYPNPTYIQAAIEDLFHQLAAENELRNLTLPTFAARAAHYYGELDAAHPFREGNSRTLRQFFADLARNAGYALTWAHVSHTQDLRDQLFHARDLAVLRGDSSALANIMEQGLRPVEPEIR